MLAKLAIFKKSYSSNQLAIAEQRCKKGLE